MNLCDFPLLTLASAAVFTAKENNKQPHNRICFLVKTAHKEVLGFRFRNLYAHFTSIICLFLHWIAKFTSLNFFFSLSLSHIVYQIASSSYLLCCKIIGSNLCSSCCFLKFNINDSFATIFFSWCSIFGIMMLDIKAFYQLCKTHITRFCDSS